MCLLFIWKTVALSLAKPYNHGGYFFTEEYLMKIRNKGKERGAAMKEYVCGLDFGTLSCRAVIVEAESGRIVGEGVSEYSHGVISGVLPDGTKIPPDFALQDPEDYLQSLSLAVKSAISRSGVSPESIKGIGLDFTSATILPVDDSFLPLCQDPRFSGNPHAYVKLWKHHGAIEEAKVLTEIFFKGTNSSYPGTEVSPEHGLPKILETFRKAPEVFDAAARFMEAGDYVNTVLTGKECHSAAYAGYKLMWQEGKGYPPKELLCRAEPSLKTVSDWKLSEDIEAITEPAGRLGKRGALLTGLPEGTAVAQGIIDAHAAIPGAGAIKDGDLVLTLGTSAAHMLQASEYRDVPGIFGCMKSGVLPGLYTYEAGQSAAGDIFSWFMKNQVPSSYETEAKARGLNMHELLMEKAALLPPGGNGLVAVDWLNGCRTPFNRADLTGMLYGLTLSTKTEEIYRAYLESVAFGTRRILENYEEHGVPVRKVFLCGGIAQKNPLLVQILADVTRKAMHIVKEKQCAALGAAVYAAAAAKLYPGIREAAMAMCSPELHTVAPQRNYDDLYRKYRGLSDFLLKF